MRKFVFIDREDLDNTFLVAAKDETEAREKFMDYLDEMDLDQEVLDDNFKMVEPEIVGTGIYTL